MKRLAILLLPFLLAAQPRPRAGPVEILKLDQVKAGMKATAWTVFAGLQPEPVPVSFRIRWL